MQQIHDARLSLLNPSAGAAPTDGIDPTPAAAQDDANLFSAVIGGIPAAPPPVDPAGTRIAGQDSETGTTTLTGSLLPANGSALPVPAADGEGVVLAARLPLELPGTATAAGIPAPAPAPNAAVGFAIENGRLRVAAGEASDALPGAVTRALPLAAAATAGSPEQGRETGPSRLAYAAPSHPVGMAGPRPALVPAAESAPATGGAPDAALEQLRAAPAGEATRSLERLASEPSARARGAVPEVPVSASQTGGASARRSSPGAIDPAALAAATMNPTDRRAWVKEVGPAPRRATAAPLTAAATTRSLGLAAGGAGAAAPGAGNVREFAADFGLVTRADAASAANPGPRPMVQAAAMLADAGHQAAEAGAARTTPLSASPPAGVPGVPTATPAFSVAPPVLDPAWQTAVGERVVWMAARGMQSAELRLNPAELGPMQLQVSVDDGRVSVSITALQAATREALEAAVPRLRELLSESGMQLAGADVSGGGVEQRRDDGFPGSAERSPYTNGADEDAADDGVLTGSADSRTPEGAVDLYA